ncbi:MAG: hypothetical protein AAF942_06575 [Pseudomonadota bacterium]
MNQIFNPAALTDEGLEQRPMNTPGDETARGRHGRIEYDDGNPATIAPRQNGAGPAATLPCGTEGGTRRDISARFRRPLTAHNCEARVEYDDGDPATIAPEG